MAWSRCLALIHAHLLAQDEDFATLLDEVVARRLDPASAAIIFGTQTTIDAGTYPRILTERGIDPARIVSQACPGLADTISEDREGAKTAAEIRRWVGIAIEKMPVPGAPVVGLDVGGANTKAALVDGGVLGQRQQDGRRDERAGDLVVLDRPEEVLQVEARQRDDGRAPLQALVHQHGQAVDVEERQDGDDPLARLGRPATDQDLRLAAINKALSDPAVQERLTRLGVETGTQSVDEFQKLLRADWDSAGAIVKAAGARIECELRAEPARAVRRARSPSGTRRACCTPG